MRKFFHPPREALSLPSILYALSDPLRLQIVAQLAVASEPISVKDCSVGGDVAKSTQSHHFKVLREAGVTCTTPRGTRLLIALRRDDLEARFPGLLSSVLRGYAAELDHQPKPQ